VLVSGTNYLLKPTASAAIETHSDDVNGDTPYPKWSFFFAFLYQCVTLNNNKEVDVIYIQYHLDVRCRSDSPDISTDIYKHSSKTTKFFGLNVANAQEQWQISNSVMSLQTYDCHSESFDIDNNIDPNDGFNYPADVTRDDSDCSTNSESPCRRYLFKADYVRTYSM
jgi:hypothetical protein